MSESDRPIPSSFDDNADFYNEGRLDKIGRKLKEEPLIPIGCLLTCYALYQANSSIRVGDKERTNRMFRARIYAQAFTLVAVVAGSIYYKEDRARRKQYDTAVSEKKAQEKRDAWIRELEARDNEDREWRDRHAAIEKAARTAADTASGVKREAGRLVESGTDGVAKSVVELRDRRSGFGILEAVKELVGRSR